MAGLISRIALLFWVGLLGVTGGQAADYATKFSNVGTIGNTRHNMTQRQTSGGGPQSFWMDNVRNDYGEICVYCHTPHGANTKISVPLWNRTIQTTTYTTYNQLGTATLTQTVSQPGAASLSCLSCHDGQTAIDSIINMPGAGRYSAGQETTPDSGFLNTWTTGGQFGNYPAANGGQHNTLVQCASCHSAGPGSPATSFASFVIGTDLRDDHPVGVPFPADAPDFFQPGGTTAGLKFFDTNGNGRADKQDIRLYKTGSEYRVECASCHDPHGVPSGGPGSAFNKTFLRKTNETSGVCFTCHNK